MEYATAEWPLGLDFPNARYLFSRKEYNYWAQDHAKTPIEAIADSVLPIIEAKREELVSSEHALDDHIRLMPTPGTRQTISPSASAGAATLQS